MKFDHISAQITDNYITLRRDYVAATKTLLLTLGAHAQRGLQYLVCVCVCVCVCVSVTQHLTFHVFIRATNDTNLLGGG